MKLNVGCGPHYADGWFNTDTVTVPGAIEPDLEVDPNVPFPFPPASVEAVYLGHVLEHMPWDMLPGLLANLTVVLAPGAEVCVVGPDVLASIRAYADAVATGHGTDEAWGHIGDVIEDDQHHQPVDAVWAEGRHHWNCYPERIVDLLENTPDLVDVRAVSLYDLSDSWPIVSRAPLQLAVLARRTDYAAGMDAGPVPPRGDKELAESLRNVTDTPEDRTVIADRLDLLDDLLRVIGDDPYRGHPEDLVERVAAVLERQVP